jgi:hypothetical protein
MLHSYISRSKPLPQIFRCQYGFSWSLFVLVISICPVCGIQFENVVTYPSGKSYVRKTCSPACSRVLANKRYYRGAVKNRPPKPPKPPKPETHRKPPSEPGDRSRSSFSDDELCLCRTILTSLTELPRCKCENSERKVRIESIGSGFRAYCEWCNFEVFSSGSMWPAGIETVRVEHRRLVMV